MGKISCSSMPRSERKRKGSATANLPAEFFVASQLMRLGHTVALTLSQTKEVDLLVRTRRGRMLTVDVKGLKNRTNWPIRRKKARPDHYYVLVSYRGRFKDPNVPPDVFVVPSTKLSRLLGRWSGTTTGQTAVAYSRARRSRFQDRWDLLE